MMKKRVLILLVMTLLLVAVMTSCAKAEVDVKINLLGQISIRMLLVVENKENGEPLVNVEDALKGIRPTIIEELEEKGFTVTEYKEDGYSGLLIENKNVDVNKLNSDDSPSQSGTKVDVNVTMEEDRIVLDIPLDFLKDYMPIIDAAKNEVEGKGGHAIASLTAPIKPANHNADEVSADGKTLTWNAFMLSSKESIHVEYSIVPLAFIAGGAVAGVAVVAVGTVLIVKAVKKKKVIPTETQA